MTTREASCKIAGARVTVVSEFKPVYGTQIVGRPAGGPDGISIAPALDTADAVIIVALPLLGESPAGPKSLKRTRA